MCMPKIYFKLQRLCSFVDVNHNRRALSMKYQETSDKCMYHTFVGSFYRHKDSSAGEICTRSCQEVQSSG